MTPSEHFPRKVRLLRPTEFARVYGRRRTAARGSLVLYAALRDKDGGRARLGISVSRRIGNAVVRNRWKRRLREAFRRVQAALDQGTDYVIVVRSGLPAEGADGAGRTERTIIDLAARVAVLPPGRER